jgi:predicted glycogen debranching enzyme
MAASRKPKSGKQASAANSEAAKTKTKVWAENGAIRLGTGLCTNLAAAEQREWLVTNGIGGFASGTVAGSATRRYHGLLMAALDPPAKRTLLVGGIDEIVRLGDQQFELSTHRWLSGAIAPQGHRFIREFRLEGAIPAWTYQAGSALLEKRLWMHRGENTTFVRYTLRESRSGD